MTLCGLSPLGNWRSSGSWLLALQDLTLHEKGIVYLIRNIFHATYFISRLHFCCVLIVFGERLLFRISRYSHSQLFSISSRSLTSSVRADSLAWKARGILVHGFDKRLTSFSTPCRNLHRLQNYSAQLGSHVLISTLSSLLKILFYCFSIASISFSSQLILYISTV